MLNRRLESEITNFRKRIVHDSVYISDAEENNILREIANLSNKRNFILAFFHGPRKDFIQVGSGAERNTGLGECTHCIKEMSWAPPLPDYEPPPFFTPYNRSIVNQALYLPAEQPSQHEQVTDTSS